MWEMILPEAEGLKTRISRGGEGRGGDLTRKAKPVTVQCSTA